MAAPGRITAIIIAALILVFGIIHLGVGIGICARYRQYNDIFRQSVGLSGFNIINGLFGIAIGILGLYCILAQGGALGKGAAIGSAVLGVFVGASLIAALALNSQAISWVKSRIAYRMTLFDSDQGSEAVVNAIQTNFQCCGQNLWLDWAAVQLGGTGSTTTNTGTGTGTGVASAGTETGAVRRRRDLPVESSPLIQAVRQRRQATESTVYGLPSGYSFPLPASCCIGGAASAAPDSLATYCTFSSSNSTTSFYINGCIPPVSNTVVSQITGIVFINTCLAILAFVFIPILMRLFPSSFVSDDPNNKQPLPNEMYQEQQQQQYQPQYQQYQPQQQQYQLQQQQYQPQQQQYPDAGYYANSSDTSAYTNYNVPTYAVYQ